MRRDSSRESIFLDTTYLLPFLGLGLKIPGYTPDKLEDHLDNRAIHISELSVFEAKAKTHKMAKSSEAYLEADRRFGEVLTTLRGDDSVTIRVYTESDDRRLNKVTRLAPDLNIIDTIIVAQAIEVGTLLTEDEEILEASESFHDDSDLKLNVINWRSLETKKNDEPREES